MGNAMFDYIHIELVYAPTNADPVLVALTVPADSTIETAIMASGLLEQFPDIDLNSNKVGVFSQRAVLSDQVSQGDRIEIYRPIRIDPKKARIVRAKK